MSDAETTTVEAPRDTSGQFTAEKFGIEGVEADQGYSHVKAPAAQPADDSPEAIYEDYKRKRGADNGLPTVRELIHLDTGEKVDPNLAITAEQAHAALTQSYSSEHAARELLGIEELRQKVDADRAERIQGDKSLADHYGVEVENTVEGNTSDTTTDGDSEYVAPSDGELHPEVQKALKHPQVRQAIEQELNSASQTREAYSAALENSRVHALATLGEVVPHLMGLPPAQFEQGLATLSQVDPPAFNSAMNILGRAHTIVQAQQQEQQRQSETARQNFETYAKAEDAKFRSMVGSITPANFQEVGKEMVAYASELGIQRDQLEHLLKTEPIMRHSAFQKMIYDAIQYRMLKSAPAKAIPKNVPSVMKPGVAASKGDIEQNKFQALRAKLGSSGSVEDAHALYKARKRRG